MSSRTSEKIVRVRAVDETTSVLLGVGRTIRAMRSEIIQLSRLFAVLADEELMAAAAAGEFAAMAQLAIPVIGVIVSGISIIAGARITAARAAIPVGQTSPGQFREITQTGAMIGHAGETIGRPAVGMGKGGRGEGGSITNLSDTIVFNSEFDTRVYSQIRRFTS